MKTPIIEGVTQAGLESYLTARQYDALYWPTFFPVKDVNSLDGKTLIGAEGSRVAAHVISYDAKAPEAGRKALSTQYFDIPKIAQSRRKTEKEILEHAITKSLRGQDAVIEDYFNDVDFVYDSAQARMEWYALVALSTTKLQLSTTNNPQGIVNETVIDFGMPSANKKCASVIWSTGNVATMDPITDFLAVVKAARAKGITFARMLMTSDTYDLMVPATLFIKYFANPALSGVTNPITLDAVNRLLLGYRIPPITIVDTSVGIEAKSGAVTATNPWSTTHVTFIPEVQCGNMFNGPIAEQINRPDGVLLSKRGNVSISIRTESNPVSVLTKAECNVFPSWPNVDRCYSLYTGHTSTWA
jgi:hypothetical protein